MRGGIWQMAAFYSLHVSGALFFGIYAGMYQSLLVGEKLTPATANLVQAVELVEETLGNSWSTNTVLVMFTLLTRFTITFSYQIIIYHI